MFAVAEMDQKVGQAETEIAQVQADGLGTCQHACPAGQHTTWRLCEDRAVGGAKSQATACTQLSKPMYILRMTTLLPLGYHGVLHRLSTF